MNLVRGRGCNFEKVSDLGKASDLEKVNDLGKACDFGKLSDFKKVSKLRKARDFEKVSDLEKATYLSLSATIVGDSFQKGNLLIVDQVKLFSMFWREDQFKIESEPI